MRKINGDEIPVTFVHNNIKRKRIVSPGDLKSSIQTMNFAYLDPGETVEEHVHADCEEIFYIIEGAGSMTVDNTKITIGNNDCIIVSSNETHAISNTGGATLTYISIRALIS